MDYWSPLMKDLRPVLTHISPEQLGFLSALNSSEIKYEVEAHNLQKVIDAENKENERNQLTFSLKGFDYEHSYHSYEEIVSELQSMDSRSESNFFAFISYS